MADKQFEIIPDFHAYGVGGYKDYFVTTGITLSKLKKPNMYSGANGEDLKKRSVIIVEERHGIIHISLEFSGETLVGYDHKGQKSGHTPEWKDMPAEVRAITTTTPIKPGEVPTTMNSHKDRPSPTNYGWSLKPLPGMTPQQTKDMVVNYLADILGNSEKVSDRNSFRFNVNHTGPQFEQFVSNLRSMAMEMVVPRFNDPNAEEVPAKTANLRTLAGVLGGLAGKEPYARWDQLEAGSYEKATANKEVNLRYNPYAGIGARESAKRVVINIEGLDRKHVAALTDMVETRGNNFTIEKGELIVDQQKTGMFSWEPLDALLKDLNRGIDKLRENGEEKIKLPGQATVQARPANANTATPVKNPATGKPVVPPVSPGTGQTSTASTPVRKAPPPPVPPSPPPVTAPQAGTKSAPAPDWLMPTASSPPVTAPQAGQGNVTGGVAPRKTPPPIPGSTTPPATGQTPAGGRFVQAVTNPQASAAPAPVKRLSPTQIAAFVTGQNYDNAEAVRVLRDKLNEAVDSAVSAGIPKSDLQFLKTSDPATQMAFVVAVRAAKAPQVNPMTDQLEPLSPQRFKTLVSGAVKTFMSEPEKHKAAFLKDAVKHAQTHAQGRVD